jgi:hypothetical protein
MREHGIRRIASAANDFAKFSCLEFVNPIRGDGSKEETAT